MSVLRSLATKGFFPEVIPPCFFSERFGELVAKRSRLPQEFNYHGRRNTFRLRSRCGRFNQARQGSLRRQWSLPNPVAFFRLAAAVSDNWQQIRKHCDRSRFSLTSWRLARSGERALTSVKLDERVMHRMKVRASASYLLRADIVRCFPSIYTHSVAWALLGKSRAKRNHSDTLLGNLLDVLLQSMQDGQTIGIPIGPDTSRLASEIILAGIDAKLATAGSIRGTRAIDDYEFGFRTLAEAEAFLARLQHELDGYELALNPQKTRIESLPQSLLEPWETELRTLEAAVAGRSPGTIDPTERELLLFIDKALELQKRYPEGGVLRFAINRSAFLFRRKGTWPLHQSFLLHCVSSDAGTLPYVIDAMLTAQQGRNECIDVPSLADIFNHLITTNAPLGHSSEVAYALWGCMLFDVRVTTAAGRAISAMEDPTVGVLALDARAKGLLRSGFRPVVYRKYFRTEALYEANWLLAYEAATHGWLPRNITAAYVDADPCFGYLKRCGVQFYHPEFTKQYIASFLPDEKESSDDEDYD